MQFKNDKQVREYLEGYQNWPLRINNELLDKRTFINEFHGAKIYVEERLHLTFFYNDTYNFDKEPIPEWGLPTYYIVPGEKDKPMYCYKESLSQAIKLIRQIDKEN